MPQLILSIYKCICRLGLFIIGRRTWPSSIRYSRRFEQLEPRVVFAGVPQLLLEQGFVPDSIGEYTEVAGTTYFVAATLETGRELWRLDDQSSTGASLVADVRSGIASSSPTNLINFGGALYFTADDGIRGIELWKSDGTASGTTLVRDINPTVYSSHPTELTELAGFLYFAADDGVNGTELWKSDGTATGTAMVENIHPTDGAFPQELTVVNDTLFFRADNGVNGFELWKTDETSGGTELVTDINTVGTDVSLSSQPTELTNVNGTLFFLATNAAAGQELWMSNGTLAGTALVGEIVHGPDSPLARDLTEAGGLLYFTAENAVSGRELWKSNGTLEGTQLVAEIAPFEFGSTPEDLINVAGMLYFTANDEVHGRELWRSDGSVEGTQLVRDIFEGPGSAYPESITNVNGLLFFGAYNGTDGFELWKSNGTEVGTVLLKDVLPGVDSAYPYHLYNAQGKLLFSAVGYADVEVWTSDGSPSGTTKATSVGFSSDFGSEPGEFTEVGDATYFVAHTLHKGTELWKTDGTAAGTVLVKDINPLPRASSSPENLINVDGILYFSADDGVHGPELWKSDGTDAGTVLVKDIHPDVDATIANLTIASPSDDFLFYFTADDGEHGVELWKSDGTASGTVMVADIFEGPEGSQPSDLTIFNNTLVFAAANSLGKRELWLSLFGQAQQLSEINPFSGSNPEHLTATFEPGIGPKLYFAADDGTVGRELWEYSPLSQNQIRLVEDIALNQESSDPRSIVPHPTLRWTVFVADDKSVEGAELRAKTPDFVTILSSIRPGSEGSNPDLLTVVANDIFLTADDGQAGVELYRIVGGGIIPVRDINRQAGSNPSNLTNVGGLLYFTADDGDYGRELWRSNGIEAGTRLVLDISPYASSNPTNLTNIGGNLFFSADNGVAGREVWMVPKNLAPTDVSLSNNIVDKPTQPETVVGTLQTADANSTDTHSYSLVSGAGDTDNAKFTIVGNELQAVTTLDFSNGPTYSIRVRTTDDGGRTFEKQFEIKRLNSSPTNLTLSNTIVAVNSAVGTVVGQLTTTDADVDDTHSYTLVAGAGDSDNAKFTIVNNELRAAATLNFTTGSAYSIRVRTTDALGGTFEKQFEIERLNQAPIDVTLSNTSVAINSPVGTVVGQLTTTDADVNDTHSYTLVVGAGDSDNAKFSIVNNQLRAAATLDFATGSAYSIRVRTTDALGGTFEKQFEIERLNQAPIDVTLSNTSVAINSPVGTVVGQLTTTDADVNDTHSYTLVAGEGDDDNAKFTIVDNQLRAAATLDFAEFPDYLVRIRTTDSAGGVFEKAFVISQTLSNPVANNDSASVVNEFTVTVDVMGNDSNTAGTTVEIVTQQAVAGSASVVDNKILFDPDNDFIGIATITYQLRRSPTETSNIATLTIGVAGSNFQNAFQFLDVNNNSIITPTDALLIIDVLNDPNSTRIVVISPFFTAPYLDVNGDGRITPSDALLVINELNSRSGGGEGEGESIRTDDAKTTDAAIQTSYNTYPPMHAPAIDDDMLTGRKRRPS